MGEGARQSADPQIRESLVRPLQGIGRGFRLDVGLPGDGQEFAPVGSCEIGNRNQLAFVPEQIIAEAGNVAHMDAAADDAPTFDEGIQGERHQRPDGGEDQRGVKWRRRLFLRASGPACAERAGMSLGRFVARAGKGIDFAPLPAADLREDVSGGAEIVEADPPGCAGAAQAAPADQPCTHQGGGGDGVGELIQREDIGRIGNDMAGEAAIASIAGEFRGVAQVLPQGAAIGTMPTCMSQPAEADTPTDQFGRDARPDQVDPANDLVAGNARALQIRQFAVNDMQIRAADRTSLDLDP